MKRRKGTVRWLAVACLFCLLLSGCQNAGNADGVSEEASETMETKDEAIPEPTTKPEEAKTPDVVETPEETKTPDAVENSDGANTSDTVKTPEKKEEVSNVCPDCNGTGTVCSECNGTTIVNCKACNQTGYESCGVCKGTNVIPCHHCKGSGKEAAPQKAPENEAAVGDGQTQQPAPAPEAGSPCKFCNGTGQQACDACNGAPAKLCTHCQDKLTHLCPVCQGNKNCTTCGGTGKIG